VRAIFGMSFAAAMAAASLMAPATAAPVLPQGHESSPVVQVEGSCGFEWYLGRDGRCYRQARREDYNERRCPPGWHWGHESRRCWRN
jgi:hypothetical protein